MVSAGADTVKRRTRRSKRFYGHMNAVIAWMIRELYFSRRMTQAQLADFFQIGQSTVHRIVSGKTWGTHEQTGHTTDPRGARPWDQVPSGRSHPIAQH